MDWLMHNPIAEMYGPRFLVVYGGAIVLALAAGWWILRHRDPTASLPPPLVPSDPDPHEIAYLRGGENEVTRTIIFDLMQRGYLQIETRWLREQLAHAQKHPDPRHLSLIERLVFDWFATPRAASSVFKSEALLSQIRPYCTRFERQLRSEQLLTPPDVRQVAWQVGGVGALIIIGLGGYKLFVALAKGRTNVGFLILIGIVSLLILVKMCRTPRLSSRGRAYVERLQLAFEQLKRRVTMLPATDPSLLLLVGLFGVGVLAGTAYASYEHMFHRAASSGGSCGGGCGSCGGGGGGDGGGGGCGGCGGGGGE